MHDTQPSPIEDSTAIAKSFSIAPVVKVGAAIKAKIKDKKPYIEDTIKTPNTAIKAVSYRLEAVFEQNF
ncbi:MAG: hypothetical protein KME23_09955 [Goleter apudmare HA4340-LM2]|jgi:hypothetical protein|nr:hypothetical protein [Goleter apudmare HA4340-LM2]